MKKVLKTLISVAVLATAAFTANNAENPLYGPAPMGFYSKTGLGWMYKKSDDNLAMKAKGWAKETENPIPRITEDFGFGVTEWFAFRGMFGYTYDGDIDRAGMHQARLGMNFRPVNDPKESVVWDIYLDAFLGGLSKMEADLVMSNTKDPAIFAKQPISFNYKNYGNGRWGAWLGTQVGKSFDKLNMAVYGEVERTLKNDNNEITIKQSAVPVIAGMVKKRVKEEAESTGLTTVCAGAPVEQCKAALPPQVISLIEDNAENLSTGVAGIYAAGLPSKFSVDTKSTWEFAAGLKTLYEINSDWSVGGAFNWKHRATNSIEDLNISIAKDVDAKLETLFAQNPNLPANAIGLINSEKITEGVKNSFVGSMKDGVDEFAFSLLGSRQLTEALQLTLWGEYTFDTAEEKAQLGTTMKAELGLRLNYQF